MGKRLKKLKGKIRRSERLNRLRAKIEAKKADYKLELKRQLVHATGLIVVIFLMMFEQKVAVKVLAILTGLIIVGNWYLSRREFRKTYFHTILHELGLPGHNSESWKKVSSNIEVFEDTVIWGLLKNFVRQRDQEPLIATFWSLFSALLAAAIFGFEFAILGLLVLSIGDSVSTLIGKKWGTSKIFWSKDKSWVGFISFVVSTMLVSIVFLKYFPQFAVISPAVLVPLLALSGALIETIPQVDDNSTIPFGVAMAVWLMFTFA